MFKALLLTRLGALSSSLFRSSRIKKKHGVGFKVLIALLTLYVIATFFLMFGIYFDIMCLPLHSAGLSWLYFALAGIAATALCFIGSVFTTQTQLFEAKDNEMLLALPIPPKYILASRMLMLLILNYFLEVFVALPAIVVYGLKVSVSAQTIIIFAAVILFLPLLIMALTCLVGWIIAIISSKIRNKNIITLAISIGALIAYFYYYSKLNTYINKLLANGAAVAASIKKAVPPAFYMGHSIAAQNFYSLLMFILWCVIPFALIYVVLSYSFIKIATAKKGASKVVYKEKSLSVSSAKWALLKKELKRFVSSPMYMLNAALGVVIIVILPFALIIKKAEIFAFLNTAPPIFADNVGVLVVLILCGVISTNFISAPSISLEGKNLWIPQSLPVDASDILMSKVNLHLIVSIPPLLFASTLFCIVLKLNLLMVLYTFLTPIIFTVFSALLGVVINLKFPKFDWISETIAVKQSFSSVITMFINMGIVLSGALLYAFVFYKHISVEIYILIFTVLLIVLSALLYWFIKTKGKKVFERL